MKSFLKKKFPGLFGKPKNAAPMPDLTTAEGFVESIGGIKNIICEMERSVHQFKESLDSEALRQSQDDQARLAIVAAAHSNVGTIHESLLQAETIVLSGLVTAATVLATEGKLPIMTSNKMLADIIGKIAEVKSQTKSISDSISQYRKEIDEQYVAMINQAVHQASSGVSEPIDAPDIKISDKRTKLTL